MTARDGSRVPCVACGKTFRPPRKDARYCSARCRQRAYRARAQQDELLRQVEEAKRHYWGCVRRYAEAFGREPVQAQLVDADGQVFIDGELVGHALFEPHPGWGLEAAGPPWSPPTDWIHESFGPERVRRDLDYRARLQAIGRPG